MIATLPLALLFFFHILLIKKGMSTYSYIIALREQEQAGGQQSPQMSPVSSITGLSSTSSFPSSCVVHSSAPFFEDQVFYLPFHSGCEVLTQGLSIDSMTLVVVLQFSVVPPETGSVSILGEKMVVDEPSRKRITLL
ncbi:hypothetical protein F511_33017 [Dorcoceras hygrometricum]|uniref:Uncharacterized protein n=1 Tax=Dorcoceras hygrometricum TaxID=472368 RepID=A0A2Z7AKJ2_9LAMI|nr:hypothetical protein F511_33017 [Dorcoceras hygrometricum]